MQNINTYDLKINELKLRMDRMAEDLMILEMARETAAQRAMDWADRQAELEEVMVRS